MNKLTPPYRRSKSRSKKVAPDTIPPQASHKVLELPQAALPQAELPQAELSQAELPQAEHHRLRLAKDRPLRSVKDHLPEIRKSEAEVTLDHKVSEAVFHPTGYFNGASIGLAGSVSSGGNNQITLKQTL